MSSDHELDELDDPDPDPDPELPPESSVSDRMSPSFPACTSPAHSQSVLATAMMIDARISTPAHCTNDASNTRHRVGHLPPRPRRVFATVWPYERTGGRIG